MNEPRRKFSLRMLVFIGSPKLAEKANRILRKGRMPILYVLRGQGTAQSEAMDVLGLDGGTKAVVLGVLPQPFAAAMLGRLNEELGLGRPNTGIAFTTAITGISSPAMQMLNETLREEIKKTMEDDTRQMTQSSPYSLVVAAVNRGFSGEVMDAARAAGAGGGTVLHARQTGGEEAMRFWGVALQEEKELVLVLAAADTKIAIMRAISEACGPRSEARGIVMSTPIDAIVGLEED